MKRWQLVQVVAEGLWFVLSLWQARHVARVMDDLPWESWQDRQFECPLRPCMPRFPIALWHVWHVGLENLWGLWQAWQLLCVAPRPRTAAVCAA